MSRASETTWFPPPRPRPRLPWPAVRTRSQYLWTPGTWACSSGPGPRIYGLAFGTGSRLALAFLEPPDTSILDTQTNCVGSTSRWMAADPAWEGVQAERLFCARSSPHSVAAAGGCGLRLA